MAGFRSCFALQHDQSLDELFLSYPRYDSSSDHAGGCPKDTQHRCGGPRMIDYARHFCTLRILRQSFRVQVEIICQYIESLPPGP